MTRGDDVQPRVPLTFPQLPANVPPDRLAVAQWLVGPENPPDRTGPRKSFVGTLFWNWNCRDAARILARPERTEPSRIARLARRPFAR